MSVKDYRKPIYLGIDGEGQGRIYHKYVYLACSTEKQLPTWSVFEERGLSTETCLEFILNLPGRPYKIFAYSFGYDLTKILTDLDNESLYKLFRPELRARTGTNAFMGPYPVWWKGYALNLQGTKFTLRRGSRTRVVWDIFKFFQGKFVAALRDWKVGGQELLERLQIMKDQRGEFDKLDMSQVKAYCLDECATMAELARKLTEAHVKAGLKLRSYYGAGSSASAMLQVMGIKKQIRRDYPEEMQEAVSCAFFGGRFENSVIGPVEGHIFSYDISSAYPYQLYFLPCLMHGTWELTQYEKHLETHKAAIVQYQLSDAVGFSWGPFPFRDKHGSISFPITSGGGWVYRDEYLAGKKAFPHVGFRKAWIYKNDCVCHPFKRISDYYTERVRIGKEGPGIVLKLGCNSCYGKLAQSVGNAPFNSWVWAGMITSGTRAQLLDMLMRHGDRRNCLMMATDGLCSLEQLKVSKPRDTGTDATGKPLGGWEEKIYPNGMFLARPGIYFPLNPSVAQMKDIRGRGIGRSVVLENWKRIIQGWPCDIRQTIQIANVSRFCGAKTSISVSMLNGKPFYRRAGGTGSEPAYGQWITRKVEMSFDPMPKRARVSRDGKSLDLRRFPRNLMSEPYDRAVAMQTREAIELKMHEEELLEQPDADWSEYE